MLTSFVCLTLLMLVWLEMTLPDFACGTLEFVATPYGVYARSHVTADGLRTSGEVLRLDVPEDDLADG